MKEQIKELTTCYDERMSLEIEAESGIGKRSKAKETQYLQSNIIFKKNTIEMYENNKNAKSINEEGKQTLLRFPHIQSYAPTKQKIAICYQGAIAIERYTTTQELKKQQFAYLEKELRGPLEYPANFIKRTIRYMRERTKKEHDHWEQIYPNVKEDAKPKKKKKRVTFSNEITIHEIPSTKHKKKQKKKGKEKKRVTFSDEITIHEI